MYLENTETIMSFSKEIVFPGKFCQTPWCQARPPPCLNNGKMACIYYHGNIRACRYLSFREKKQLWTTIIQNLWRKTQFSFQIFRDISLNTTFSMESDICTAIVHHSINIKVGRKLFESCFLKQGCCFLKQSWTQS